MAELTHLDRLLYRALTDGKGEHVALLLREMGRERHNWAIARAPIGAASTWLITYDDDQYRHALTIEEFLANITKYIHAAGFTSEELIAPLELLVG